MTPEYPIDWFGEKPSSWYVKRLKYICDEITDGSHFSPDTTDFGYPYITAADVNGKGLDYEKAKCISEYDFNILVSNGCALFKDDVLLVKDGATTGRTGMVTECVPAVALSSVAMLRVTDTDPNYFYYTMCSDVMQKQIRISMAGSAMPRTTVTKIGNYYSLVCPPVEEQRAIAARLDSKVAEIDDAIAIKRRLAARLRDYRTSLINEYVTGKRRVKGAIQ